MTVKEYPSEDRVEYIIPDCPKCGKKTRYIEYPMMGTETVISLLMKCRGCNLIFRPDDEDIIIIQKYPPNRISIVV